MRALKAVADRMLPILFWIAVMLAFDTPCITVMTVIAAVIHEGGHILAAMLVGYADINLPRAALTGLRITTGQLLSYRDEAIIAAGGPSVNLAVFLLLCPFFKISTYLFLFALINLLTAISNLLPVKSYDGYRIINRILCLRTNAERADAIVNTLSLGICAVGCFISLYLMMKLGEGYWIFAVFFSVTVREIIKLQNRINSENTRDFESI